MQILSRAVALSLAYLAGTSVANPVPADTNALSRRGGQFPDQILYAINCVPEWCHGWDTSECHQTASFLAWYKDWRKSQHGENPDSITREYKKWDDPRDTTNPRQGFPLVWEDHDYDLWFPDSNSNAHIHINLWANWQPSGATVGWAKNAFGDTYECKRDNERQIWGNYNGYRCYAIYYCPKNN